MAQHLYFARDSKLFIEFNGTVWEIPVLDGFSFTQSTNSTEITLSEMESSLGVSRRGRRAFNDSLAPVEWSFSTYVRPFVSAGTGLGAADSAANHHAVEEILWALWSGADTYSSGAFSRSGGGDVTVTDTTDLNIDFSESNVSSLGTCNLYFVLGSSNRQVYKISGAAVNEASIDFEIDGIASINWSGMGAEIADMWPSTIESAAQPTDGDTTNDSSDIAVGDIWLDSDDNYRLRTLTNVTAASEASTTLIYEATNATDNFIRNRLSTLVVDGTGQSGLENSYSMTLTGGNITMSNNITYITPEELGVVNVPIGHVTGTRSVSGSFTCYLNRDDTSSNDTYSSNFFEDMKAIYNTITNDVALTFKIGGSTTTPNLEVDMQNCHIEIPTHSIEDVITVETTFQALPSGIDATDDATLTYKGA